MPTATNDFYADRLLNLAHRGASFDAPENTMPAFRLAREMGADGVELDAQLSKDGEVVILHDFSVDKTTNGRGLVRQKTLAELKLLDAGSHFSSEFAGTRIPTLAELFTELGSTLLYNIELKTTDINNQGLEAEVIRLIEDHQLQQRVMLSSFNPFSLWRARRLNPKIKRGLLWSPNLPLYLRWQLFRSLVQPDMFHPHWQAVTPLLVQKEHQQNHLVNVWTCNEPEDMVDLIRVGVDSIMTDRPDVLKRVLDGSEAH
jgi:glycerophosphoryl diester phosphodiesterase